MKNPRIADWKRACPDVVPALKKGYGPVVGEGGLDILARGLQSLKSYMLTCPDMLKPNQTQHGPY